MTENEGYVQAGFIKECTNHTKNQTSDFNFILLHSLHNLHPHTSKH